MIALVTGCPQRALAPEHPKTQGPLGPVVGSVDAVLDEKDPERVHLPQQATREPARVVLPGMILLNQFREPGVPAPPSPPRGWGCGHMTRPLQRGQRPGATGREVWLGTCRQPSCRADEVGQAGLPRLDPMLVHAIPITDQDASPVVN